MYRAVILAVVVFSVNVAIAQEQTESPLKLTPKELNIGSASIFDLMGVTPSQIARPSDVRDVKVDWSFKNWRLNPNLAIQAQPVWEAFYNRRDLSKFVNAPRFMQRLSTLELSLGTVQSENQDRRIGYAAKLNLYREKDPLLQKDFFKEKLELFSQELNTSLEQIALLKLQLRETKDAAEYLKISNQIIAAENERSQILNRQRDELRAMSEEFMNSYWNGSFLDVGYGKVNSYFTDSAGTLKSIRRNRNTGEAFWVSGGFGLGKKCLITAMVRTLQYDEQINFTLRDTITLEETPKDTVVDNRLLTYGLNIRYGTPYFNLFFEYFTDIRNRDDNLEIIRGDGWRNDQGVSPDVIIVAESVAWNKQPVHSLTLGGDWRFSKNVMLNFGMRMEYDRNWKKQTFTPIVSVSCLMR